MDLDFGVDFGIGLDFELFVFYKNISLCINTIWGLLYKALNLTIFTEKIKQSELPIRYLSTI